MDFLSRINFIIGDRRAYPWGEAIGIGRGVVQRIRDGVVPGGEALAAITRSENASLSWLLAGTGRPFLVGCCPTDAECADQVDALLEEPGWTVYFITDGQAAVLVLTQPAQFEVRDRPIDYTAVEVLAGPIGPETSARLRAGDHPVHQVQTSPRQVADLAAGRVGTYALTAEGGLLERAKPGPPQLGDQAAEAAPAYGDQEGELRKIYRALRPEHQTVALATARALRDAEE